MKLAVMAVKDKKTGLFDQPFNSRHPNEAIREWNIVTKDTNTKYGKNPEDFDLYQIATYDQDNGDYENFSTKKQIATGIQGV